MLQLVLMRHAKSAPGDESLADIDRPLNDRGREDAPRIGRWLEKQRLVPQRVLCSPARRTRETAEAVMRQWSGAAELSYDRGLYQASGEEILRTVRGTEEGNERLMVIGHNPGMAALVWQLAQDAEPGFPTAAVAVFEIDAERWSDAWRGVRLVAQVAPKQLEG